jgi:HTH-type transcriptional regulator/antitoxin HigA
VADDYRTPGQLIQALLDERGWTQQILAIVLGADKTVISKYISDKRPIDAGMALSLGEVFDLPPETFLDIQKRYDLEIARVSARPDPARATRAHLYGDLPVGAMIKRGWIAAPSLRDTTAVGGALAKFFGATTVEEIEILPHAAKKTSVFSPVTAPQLAWIYRAKQLAKDMLVARYSPDAARTAAERLIPLRSDLDAARHVPRILAESGIRFVIVEALPASKIDGVCFWLNDFAPVIGMSLRHDRIYNFWFVLRHELEHVIQRHGRDAMMVDADLESTLGDQIADEERVANAAAAEFCVPAKQLQQFIDRKAPFFAERDLIGFARTIKVHPGLVAGQLRHHLGRFDRFHTHLAKVRHVVAPNAVTDGWGDVAPTE